MKIFAISDLHLASKENKPMEVFGGAWENHWEKIKTDWNQKVCDDDIVLIAGDISWAMRLDNAIYDLNEIGGMKGKKILIKGNHDYWWSSLTKIREILQPNTYILQNDAIKFGSFIFAGSRGWTVPEIYEKSASDDLKIYLRETERLKLSLNAAKKLVTSDDDKIVAMMHFPPFNSIYEDSAFTDIFKENNVSLVVYGHLHGNNSRFKSVITKNNIPYYLTSCDKLDFKLLQINI